MTDWNIVTTEPMDDQDGNPIPIGTVINTVTWDGVSEWTPPPGTKAVQTAE